MRRFILASTSPRRKEILEKTRINFEVQESFFEEDMSLKLEPFELAKHLSEGKAENVAAKNPDSIVLGADTFIVYNDQILGKPKDEKYAQKMLEDFSGNTLSVITGFTIIDSSSKKAVSRAVETKVHFRKLSKQDIEGYVESGEPLDKAGAFGIQGLGAVLIDKIEGDFYNVVGLPLTEVIETLKDFGIDIWKIS